MTSSKKTRPVTGRSSTWVRLELRLQDRELVAVAGAAVAAVKGCGRRASHLRRSASIFSADSPSQSACSRSGSAQARMPLSSGLEGDARAGRAAAWPTRAR